MSVSGWVARMGFPVCVLIRNRTGQQELRIEDRRCPQRGSDSNSNNYVSSIYCVHHLCAKEELSTHDAIQYSENTLEVGVLTISTSQKKQPRHREVTFLRWHGQQVAELGFSWRQASSRDQALFLWCIASWENWGEEGSNGTSVFAKESVIEQEGREKLLQIQGMARL